MSRPRLTPASQLHPLQLHYRPQQFRRVSHPLLVQLQTPVQAVLLHSEDVLPLWPLRPLYIVGHVSPNIQVSRLARPGLETFKPTRGKRSFLQTDTGWRSWVCHSQLFRFYMNCKLIPSLVWTPVLHHLATVEYKQWECTLNGAFTDYKVKHLLIMSIKWIIQIIFRLENKLNTFVVVITSFICTTLPLYYSTHCR